MIDISGFDVILDMDELTTHWVVSDCDLSLTGAFQLFLYKTIYWRLSNVFE